MVDRLTDLGPIPAQSRSESIIDESGQRPFLNKDTDLEMGESRGQSDFMALFFQEVGVIKSKMSIIRKNVKLIEQKHGQALTAISVEQGKKNADELEQLMDETQATATEIRNMLKKMDKDNQELAKSDKTSSEARIRLNMHGTLTRKFVDLMSEQQDVQTKYKAKYKERVERQYRIVNPNATQEELESIGNADSIFADQIITPGHAAAKNALADIQDKHKDIVKLETSIRELHQLFVDMAIMVETQGEILDQIEHHVVESVKYVEKGVQQLTQARDYQKAARKKQCMIIVCLVILIAVIVIPIVIARK